MIYPWTHANWKMLHTHSGSPTGAGALLLAGPRGVGKRTFARALAQGMLCADPQAEGEPCGACMSCRLFSAASHPDFRLVEPAVDEGRGEASDAPASGAPVAKHGATAILVGQVRELADFLIMASQLAGPKVVLIQPADRLHPSAAGALLKTLEEPPARTAFILVTDRPQRVPPTIRSRCFRVDFPLPARDTALSWLAAEGIEHPQIALAHAGFSPLTAADMDRSGLSRRRRALNELLVRRDADPAALAAEMDPGELPLVCQALQRWCYDLLSLRLAGHVRYNPDYAEKLRELADNADVHQLESVMDELVAAARALEHPLNARLAIEQLAIRYSRTISRQPP